MIKPSQFHTEIPSQPEYVKDYFYLNDDDLEQFYRIGQVNLRSVIGERINEYDALIIEEGDDLPIEKYTATFADRLGKDDMFILTKDETQYIHENENALEIIFNDDNVETSATIDVPADNLEQHPNKSKSQKQHAAILEVIKQLGYDRMSIPDGKKPEIESVCRENDKPKQLLFGVDGSTSFDNAWKSGRKLNLFKMANHYNYAKRDK